MGKIDPKDIYVAKDGTVYRVAEDGSLIKIKDGPGGGEPQKAQEPYKPKQPYQEPVTYHQETPQPPRKKKHKWRIILLAVHVIVAIIAILIMRENHRRNTSYLQEAVDTALIEAAAPEAPAKEVAEPAVETAPAAESAPVGNDGRHEISFYGTIGDNAVHGCLIVYDTDVLCEADGGWYCYDSGGSGDRMTVFDDSGGGNPRSFSEYYGSTYTGRWTLYWDETSANFANGTFTRASDGKEFPIRLYKSNY